MGEKPTVEDPGPEADGQGGLEQAGAEPSAPPDEIPGRRQLVFRHNGERFDPKSLPPVEPHDFANPLLLNDLVLRALRQRHEQFASLVSARLALFLRMDFALSLQRVSTVAYRRFTADVPNPSHVTLFKVDQLPGVGVLDVNPRLGLSLVNRLLGGKGALAESAGGLTELEMNLLDDVVLVVLEEWCRLWGGERHSSAVIIGRENGGRYLQTSASDTVMLVGTFEGRFGEVTERVQIALPFPSVEPSVRSIVALMPAGANDDLRDRRPTWTAAYSSIPLPLSVEWDACKMTVREVVGLEVGSVIRLVPSIIRETRVRLSGMTKFEGEIGLDGDRLAVRIERSITTKDV